MLSKDTLDAWLIRANLRYRQAGLHPKQRPFEALKNLSTELKVPMELGSEPARYIFEWFRNETQEGSHAIGPLFTGAYYFDACFWPVAIPVTFGRNSLNPFDALQIMSVGMKNQICSDIQESENYVRYWIDCLDYANGPADLDTRKVVNPLALNFLVNGRLKLDATIAQLLAPRINPEAILGAGLVAEIYLKVLVIEKGAKDENFLKNKLGHDLGKAMDACLAIMAIPDFVPLRAKLTVFPPVADRYTGAERPIQEVWDGHRLAQAIATAVIRILSGRDARPKRTTPTA
jgi:hypothetical protein